MLPAVMPALLNDFSARLDEGHPLFDVPLDTEDRRNDKERLEKLKHYNYATKDVEAGQVLTADHVAHAKNSPAELRKKEEERKHQSHLQYLLQQESYRKLYTQLQTDVYEAQAASEETAYLLTALDERLTAELVEMQSNRHVLEDGTEVYVSFDENLNVRAVFSAETGEDVTAQLSQNDIDALVYEPDIATWEEYQAKKSELDRVRRNLAEVHGYQDFLHETRERMTNEENPMNEDELKDAIERIESDRPAVVAAVMADTDDLEPAEKLDAYLRAEAAPSSSDQAGADSPAQAAEHDGAEPVTSIPKM